jgi:predicted nucleic acid-binding protein
MKHACIDANVIIRLITDEPPEMAEEAEHLFASVDQGEITLFVADVVVAEVVWVLKSFYGFSPAEISTLLVEFLSHDGLQCEDKLGLIRALSFYNEKNIDFIDALLAVQMARQKVNEVYSFDTHFDRLPGITRLIPGQ